MRLFHLALFATAIVLGACPGTEPTPIPGPDAGAAGKDAGCSNPCGSYCCTTGETCDDSSNTCRSPCTRQCDGRSCGEDGCGSTCGTCSAGTLCANGVCVACTPNCSNGKVCGDNGCGGVCGVCGTGTTCNAATGQCGACVKQCAGKNCGPDSCGGTCGTCAGSTTCNGSGQCVCSPDCTGKSCGDNGCGGSCGSCTTGKTCNASGQCAACTPNCGARVCGDDPAGCSCGICQASEICSAGSCQSCAKPCGATCCQGAELCDSATSTCKLPCTPQCAGKECGPDGCNTGGNCGTCGGGESCDGAGQCVSGNLCAGKPPCASGESCNPSNGSCECSATSCPAGSSCSAQKHCVACTPQCSGRTCGDNGCGGLCGTCGANQTCVGGTCQTGSTGPSSCTPPPATYNPNFAASQWCDARAAVICDRMAKCCVLGAGMHAACVAYEKKTCETQDISARHAAGALILNLSTAKACLDKESQRFDCGSNMTELIYAECDASQTYGAGHTTGQSCLYRWDCVNGRCSRGPAACGGTCQPFRQAGETCNSNDQFCDPATLYCASTCTAMKAPGTPCSAAYECQLGSICAGATGAKVCTTTAAAGGACALGGAPCPTGYRCNGAGPTCNRYYSGAIGQNCTGGSDCQWGTWCKGGGSSTTFGACSAFTALGLACGPSTGECGPAAFCSSTTGCTAKKSAGEACLQAFECKYGLRCNGTQCVELGASGATCGVDAECQRYLRCDSSTLQCTDLAAPVGGACSLPLHCGSGAYCNTSTKLCGSLVGDGAFCSVDASCSSGDCESSACRAHCSY